MSSTDFFNACSRDCFSILDSARTKHQLRNKESLFINWLKTTLNQQKSHRYVIFFVHLTFLLLALFPFVTFFHCHTPFQTF